MVKTQALMFSALVILGAADLITTVLGITGKAATEANPVFAALTQTNIMAFVGLKTLTVAVTGFMFIGTTKIAKASANSFCAKYFVNGFSIISCFILALVVANNILVLVRLP
jgi:hypothetical protein